MSRNEKLKSIRLIEGSALSVSEALGRYDIPGSTFYRWKHKMKSQGIAGLEDNAPITWNQLLPSQVDKILKIHDIQPRSPAAGAGLEPGAGRLSSCYPCGESW
jgi:transposase